MPTSSRSRRQVASSPHPTPRPGFAVPQGRRPARAEPCFFPVHEVRHLVDLHDLARRLARGLRRGLAGRAQPPVDRDVADARELGDHALAGVAHGVEQDRQGLHGLGFAALRRGGEVAAAGLAEVALVAPYRAVLDERRPGAPLAAHLDQPCPPDPAVEPSYQTVDLWVNVSMTEPASSARAPSAKHSVISGLIDMTPSSFGKRRAVPRFRGAGRAKGRGLHRGPTPPRMSSRRLVTNGPCSIAGTVPTMSTITRPIVDGCSVSFHYSGQTFPPRTSEETIEVEARWSEGDLGRRKLIRRSRTRPSERSRETAMSNDDRRCLVLAEISNGTRMECHMTEIEIDRPSRT